MTETAPKPIADCPNPECGNPCETDEFDSSHWVWCRACKYCGPETTLGEDEAIRLHNALCRPQQSAEPIQLFMCEIPRLTLKPGLPYIFGIDPECEKCAAYISGAASPGPSELVERPNPETQAVAWYYKDVQEHFTTDKFIGEGWMMRGDAIRLYRSPVESAPALAPFEKLIEELRYWADKYEDADNTVQTQIADRLSAIVKENSK